MFIESTIYFQSEHFEHFDTSTLELFSVKLATFYDNLVAHSQSELKFTSPYVDSYSKIGTGKYNILKRIFL